MNKLSKLYLVNPGLREKVTNFLAHGNNGGPVDIEHIQSFTSRQECSRNKYAKDYEIWLARNIIRATEMGLYNAYAEGRSLSILDLGCGGAIFPAVAKSLGHSVIATDLDIEDTVFTHVADAQSMQRLRMAVRPFKRIGDEIDALDGKQFDLVTGFATCFNHFDIDGNKVLWGKEEWDFFIKDVKGRLLSPNGKIYLQMNASIENVSAMSSEVTGVFKSHGASILGEDSTVPVAVVKERTRVLTTADAYQGFNL